MKRLIRCVLCGLGVDSAQLISIELDEAAQEKIELLQGTIYGVLSSASYFVFSLSVTFHHGSSAMPIVS